MLSILMSPELAPFWTAFSAIAQALAIILSVLALFYTMFIFKASMVSSHYNELDSMFKDLLQMAMDKPHLRIAGAERTGNEIHEYNTYAFMVWNFVETVYDRSRKSRHLRDTWYPVMKNEKLLHMAWLEKPENAANFKEEFINFMKHSESM
jgi:hypothetical protein